MGTSLSRPTAGMIPQVGHSMWMRRLRIWVGVLVCLAFQFPLLWMVMTSFKHQRDIFTTPPTIFFTPTLSAYTHVLTTTDLPLRMLNTLIIALGSGLLSIVAGSMA